MKILVVEDDHTIALGLEYSLKQEGYAVTIAHTVQETMEYLKTRTV